MAPFSPPARRYRTIGYYLASTLDYLGLQYVTAGVGRLLLFLYPTIVVLLSAAFFKKPVRGRDAAALIVTYIGVALVLSAAMGGENLDLATGAALVFGSAVTSARANHLRPSVWRSSNRRGHRHA